jgi:uncharacterized membrane protein YjfL (UPF0719 family)
MQAYLALVAEAVAQQPAFDFAKWAPGALHAAALLLESILLMWVAKKIGGLVLRRNIDKELTVLDNPAAAIAIAGYYFGVFLALAGLLSGESHGLVTDLRDVALHGLAAIALMSIALYASKVMMRVSLSRDIIANRNVGSALVLLGVCSATGLIYQGAISGTGGGWLQIIVFFFLGQGVLFCTAIMYEVITPYDIFKVVSEDKNIAAAAGFAGAIVAMGFITGNAAAGDSSCRSGGSS